LNEVHRSVGLNFFAGEAGHGKDARRVASEMAAKV